MRIAIAAAGVLAAFLSSSPALAGAPAEGSEIYAARTEPGEYEVEARYHALNGGPAGGENLMKIEGYYGVSSQLRVALSSEFEREPGGPRKAEEVAFEAIYQVPTSGPVYVGLYGEFSKGLNGNSDGLESKILLQYLRGTFDARLNLIAGKALGTRDRVEFGYAAQADVEVIGATRMGVQAFGSLGTSRDFLPANDHFVGPMVSTPLTRFGSGPQLEIEAGYLFAIGKTRDDTKGQLRVALEFEY
jgi:hypothetical protein